MLSYRDRVRGCLLGGALGDALGAGIEFLSLDEIRRRHGPAGVTGPSAAYGVDAPLTDDTQLTLFTAEGLIRASVRGRSRGICHPPTVLWRAYQRWLVTQREPEPAVEVSGWLAGQPVLYAQRGPGNACLSGLSRAAMGTPANPANPDSKGCGAVMRSAPFGLLRREPEEAWALAVECAVLTHGHPSGFLAAGALAWIIAMELEGATVVEAAESALRRAQAEEDGGEVAAALRAALDAAAAAGGAEPPSRPRAAETDAHAAQARAAGTAGTGGGTGGGASTAAVPATAAGGLGAGSVAGGQTSSYDSGYEAGYLDGSAGGTDGGPDHLNRPGTAHAAARAAVAGGSGSGSDSSGSPAAARQVEALGGGWVAEEALAIAVFCAARTPANPAAALLAAVNHSGDSDSTGAICGNLVGAALGERALPARWVAGLEGYHLVGQVADDLVREITHSAEVADLWGDATNEWAARYPGS